MTRSRARSCHPSPPAARGYAKSEDPLRERVPKVPSRRAGPCHKRPPAARGRARRDLQPRGGVPQAARRHGRHASSGSAEPTSRTFRLTSYSRGTTPGTTEAVYRSLSPIDRATMTPRTSLPLSCQTFPDASHISSQLPHRPVRSTTELQLEHEEVAVVGQWRGDRWGRPAFGTPRRAPVGSPYRF